MAAAAGRLGRPQNLLAIQTQLESNAAEFSQTSLERGYIGEASARLLAKKDMKRVLAQALTRSCYSVDDFRVSIKHGGGNIYLKVANFSGLHTSMASAEGWNSEKLGLAID